MMRKSIGSLLALLLVLWAQAAIAEDVSVETVLTGLSRPSSVTIRPGGTPDRYEVFVAESGARRIIRMSSNEPNRSSDAITGFPESSGGYGGPTDSPGGILFLDEKHLVVSVAGAPPELRLYELTEAGTSLSANQAKQQVTPELSPKNSEAALGICRGLARTRANDNVADMLFVTIYWGRPVHGVWKVPVRANVLGTMTQFEMKAGVHVSRRTPLAVSEQGYLLAIDSSRERVPEIELTFLNPTNGQEVLSFQPHLRGIGNLAYSPETGNLYALGSTRDNDEGLFRIDDASKPGERQIAVTKLADVEQPAALAFAPDGALYVTTLGGYGKTEDGALLKVTGEL